MAEEIKVDSAAAAEAAQGFGTSGDSVKDAGSQLENATDVFSTFEGAVADAMAETFAQAIVAQGDIGESVYSIGLAISSGEQIFSTADDQAAAGMK